MFDFKTIVEELLLEADVETEEVLTFFKTKIPNVTEEVLTQIYNLLASSDKYIAGEKWEPYIDFTPIFNAIVQMHGGSYSSTREAMKKIKPLDKETFYTSVNLNINDPAYEKYTESVKPLDRGFDFKLLVPDVKSTYDKAIKHRSKEVLLQNVWPSLQKLTITDAVTKILTDRLTGLERTRLHFSVPISLPLKTFKSYDNIIADALVNYDAYSRGSKKYSNDIATVLSNINIVPEDIIKIATYTVEFYKAVIFKKFKDKADQVIKDSLTPENLKTFAKTGVITFVYSGATSTSKTVYSIEMIEKENNEPGKNLINELKSISTGVRVNDANWQKTLDQRFTYATQALGALAAAGGAKLYAGS